MDTLHWPLSVLSRAIHFKNLTGASAHVGLSQPQLSRLISQIEKEYDVTLLDRSAKRKSGWTPAAFRLAEVYTQNSRKLQSSIQEILVQQTPTHLHLGTLEGLSGLAAKMAHSLFKKTKVMSIELDVYDQTDLEERFFNGDLDIVFSSRIPSKQKYKHCIEVGFQTLEQINKNPEFSVLSSFEFGRLKKNPDNKVLISNSLALRRHWLDDYGGVGTLPSSVQKTRGKDQNPVIILATELFHESLWDAVEKSLKE